MSAINLDNLYKDYQSYINENIDITETEYSEIMNKQYVLTDLLQEIIKYGRFANFADKWLKEHNNVEKSDNDVKYDSNLDTDTQSN